MADDQATTDTATRPEPKAVSNGATAPKATTSDGHGHTKYAPGDKGQHDDDKKDEKPQANPRRKIALGVIGVVVLVIALLWGVRYYHYSQTHVSTDDAYVTGNLINVSPIIGGTLSQLVVDEGDTVRKGQLIARLEDSGQRAALRQAQAAYDVAISQVPQARLSLTYQQQATEAAIRKAQAEVSAQQAKTSGARQQVTLAAATVQSQIRQAGSQLAQAQAQAAGADAQVRTAQAVIQAQRQAIVTAQRAANAAQAEVASAQAAQTRSQLDLGRYASLVKAEAVTQQQYDQVLAAKQTADAQLDAAQQQAAQAQSQVAQARAAVTQALAQLQAAQKQADAVRQQIAVARAGVGLAEANLTQPAIQQTNVANNIGQGGQAEADLATAQAGEAQNRLRRSQVTTAEAQVRAAQASLANAQVEENDTSLYAPSDGTVVKKAVNTGAALSPGQTIVTITQGDYVYVTANFKETQLQNVRPGETAEVEVDSFPGRIFRGRVHSLNEATGASISLLPPDNATGNFTKVVQRIPVRIELIPASESDDKQYARADDIRNLRQGMSVTATIATGDDDNNRQTAQNGAQPAAGSEAGRGTPSGTASGQAAPGAMSAPDQGTASSPGTAATLAPMGVSGSSEPSGANPSPPPAPSGVSSSPAPTGITASPMPATSAPQAQNSPSSTAGGQGQTATGVTGQNSPGTGSNAAGNAASTTGASAAGATGAAGSAGASGAGSASGGR